MNIYFITQDTNVTWDTYEAMIVIAINEERAKQLTIDDMDGSTLLWAEYKDLKAMSLGKATKGSEEKIVFRHMLRNKI